MGALTSARNTQRQGTSLIRLALKMRGGAKVEQGGMVAVVDGYGLACAPTATKPGTGDGYLVQGIALQTVDNTSGQDGDLIVEVDTGVFKLGNDSSPNAVAQANVGEKCYVKDDQTVTTSSSSHSVAGIVERIDDDGGVWVLLGKQSA